MGTPSPLDFFFFFFGLLCSLDAALKKSRTVPLNIRLFSHELELCGLENRIRNAYLFSLFDYWSIFQTNVKIILAIMKSIDL